ncbi:hypothetical protein AN9263.2 [Aspergillus nidulans FGSC A4]|uniref:Uncharacterized protein n=1 Tax=Emericella nidulans (strain FGSC A4 / ATCC 38163 / CBS 112.46 / NRRL 194 / M139) TaxID=227321 RepID=Q5AR17_EMENI|nr:hypothetical protein [Aspergillus nidulans FGSC A4]EAA66330.1 hypothetical protein AN9263.2 [Aspergillus nidulans FGSC A4]CBF87277.1 TPA: hypothetical protein ANIA_09263 [Aspergillus nidulans FGSC A4]|eukprot:XP_682532.1 hypothetical protein AN9263.2 [Aspergillus nidulans FGSC A4]
MKAISVLFLLPFAHYGLAKIRSSPSLMDPATSPAGARALLEKRDTCESGSQCIIGSCCGYDSCAYNCCGIGMDGEPVGCGFAQSCDYASQSVFIGCCDQLQIGYCTGTATEITMSTIFGEVSPTDEPSSTSLEPTQTTTTSDEPTETSTSSQTSFPIATSTSSSSEEGIETLTDSVTSTSTASVSTNSASPTAETDTMSVPTPTIPETTETDAAVVLNPGILLDYYLYQTRFSVTCANGATPRLPTGLSTSFSVSTELAGAEAIRLWLTPDVYGRPHLKPYSCTKMSPR